MFCQIFDVKMLEDPTVCLGLRGLQTQRQEGMLSGFGTLIPSAPEEKETYSLAHGGAGALVPINKNYKEGFSFC